MNKDIASVFEWFAQESTHIAEQANEPNRRENSLTWRCCGQSQRRTGVPKKGS